MFGKKKTIVKTYKGRSASATQKAFVKDAQKMADKGYQPASQQFEQGHWGTGAFLIALILCFVVIGIIALIYMLIVKPEGTLTVTYTLQDKPVIEETKVCTQCAETVKAAANVCRYCSHSFNEEV